MQTLEEAYQLLTDARDDHNENVRDLNPVFAWRVALALEKLWGMFGHRSVTIESAVRTKAEQTYLYNGYIKRLPGFNLAANPNRRIAWNSPIGPVYGSWHMEQPDGYGYAIDFSWSGGVPVSTLHSVMNDHGVTFVVPGESWHAQSMYTWGWVAGPMPPPPPSEPEKSTTQGEDMIYFTMTGLVPHAWLSYGGVLRYISQQTAFGANADDPAAWKNFMPTVPCTIGQLASLRDTARRAGHLQDHGADQEMLPQAFWDMCPYTVGPTLPNCNGGATNAEVTAIVQQDGMATRTLTHNEASATRDLISNTPGNGDPAIGLTSGEMKDAFQAAADTLDE